MRGRAGSTVRLSLSQARVLTSRAKKSYTASHSNPSQTPAREEMSGQLHAPQLACRGDVGRLQKACQERLVARMGSQKVLGLERTVYTAGKRLEVLVNDKQEQPEVGVGQM